MAISWNNVVGNSTVDDGGYAGDLLKLALDHLASSRDNSQLTEENVGEVYAATINAAIAQAIQFELAREMTDLELERKRYELNNILPTELEKLEEEIDLLQTQDSELLLNGVKDRALKDGQIDKLEEEIDLLQTQDSELLLNGVKDRALKDAQLVQSEGELAAKIELLQAQTVGEDLKNGKTGYEYVYYKSYYDDEGEKVVTQITSEQSPTSYNGYPLFVDYTSVHSKTATEDATMSVYESEILKIQEEIGLLQTQDSEMSLNGVKNREKLDEEIDLLQTQDSEMQLDGLANRDLTSANISLTEAKEDLEADKLTTAEVQRDLTAAQIILHERQTEGFDDNKNQKLLEAQLSSWSLMFSSGMMGDTMPSIISKDAIGALYNTLKPDEDTNDYTTG